MGTTELQEQDCKRFKDRGLCGSRYQAWPEQGEATRLRKSRGSLPACYWLSPVVGFCAIRTSAGTIPAEDAGLRALCGEIMGFAQLLVLSKHISIIPTQKNRILSLIWAVIPTTLSAAGALHLIPVLGFEADLRQIFVLLCDCVGD